MLLVGRTVRLWVRLSVIRVRVSQRGVNMGDKGYHRWGNIFLWFWGVFGFG